MYIVVFFKVVQLEFTYQYLPETIFLDKAEIYKKVYTEHWKQINE